MYFESASGTLTKDSTCPLCGKASFTQVDIRIDAVLVICPSCGKFRFSAEAGSYLGRRACGESYKVSHATRTAAERARGKRDNSFFPIYTAEEFQGILDQPDDAVQHKINSLLQYLCKISDFPGAVAEFDAANDYTVLGAKNADEAQFYMQTLAGQYLLSDYEPYVGSPDAKFTVSAKGWAEIEQISRSGQDSSTAFVAMWFDPARTLMETAITDAIQSAGYQAIRIDRVEHLNRIDDEIMVRIRQSKFLIADVTGQRNGVYFEAGFMLGLGRPVIWICEKADLPNVHFDTRQYNTIIYETPNELRDRLRLRIVANLGQGPH